MRHVENEAILILDFGGQYAQLMARRVRDCHVFCEIKSYKTSVEEIINKGYKGIILTGGSNSVGKNLPQNVILLYWKLVFLFLVLLMGREAITYAWGEVSPRRKLKNMAVPALNLISLLLYSLEQKKTALLDESYRSN